LKRITVFIYSCFLCLQLQAQSPQLIDSLKRDIDSHPGQDSFRVKSIFQYLKVNLYNTSNLEPYISEMLSISRKIDFGFGIRKGLIMYVKYYGNKGDFKRSFSYADSLTIFLKNDTSAAAKRDMGIVYWDMANNYNIIGNYNKAIEYYFLAVNIFEKVQHKNFLTLLYINISDVYAHVPDTVKAIVYTKKALITAEESGDEEMMCHALLSYAVDLINRGQFYKAREVLDEVEPIVLRLENMAYAQNYFYSRGLMAQLQNDLKKAIPYFRQSLVLAKRIDNVHQVTAVMKLMFESFNAIGNLNEAKIYLDSTLLVARESGLKMRRKEVYDGFATWYGKKRDHKSANAYLKKSIALNDSLISEENNKEIASLEMRYQVAGKESEIRSLRTEKELQQLTIRQKNILNYILIGSAITLLIVSLLSYRTYKQKQKLQQQRISELETERQLTTTEAVLKGEEQERTRLAKDLHDGLGGMLSGIKYSFNTMKGNLIMTPENNQAFERSMDMLDSSIKEMRRVAHNMMPEALVKFGLDTALRDYCNDINQNSGLQVSYQSIDLADANPDQTTAITIYRIVQELISNAMKHAAAQKVIVQITKSQDQLAVTVEDDGKGFDITILNQSKGIGWTNIQHRVDFLKGKVDIHSQAGKGTSVYIEFSV
jgi:two-component system NarL family sensor kinase